MRTTYDSLGEFYNEERRRISLEVDYGVWWRDGDRDWPRYRVSWVENTGEVYALNLPNGDLTVLGVIDGRERVEAVLDGWAEECGSERSLQWVRRQLASAGVSA